MHLRDVNGDDFFQVEHAKKKGGKYIYPEMHLRDVNGGDFLQIENTRVQEEEGGKVDDLRHITHINPCCCVH